MLAPGYLMMGGLDGEAHLDQGPDDLATDALRQVHRTEVEVAAEVVGDRGRAAVLLLEKEKLQFRAYIHLEAHLPGPFQLAAQNMAGVSWEGLAAGQVYIADHPGLIGAVLVAPGKDAECGKVRLQDHIRLLNPGKTLYG